MTDMRATERLLEVIEENATEIDLMSIHDGRADAILEAIIELRRRGDTLVQAADLREVCEGLGGGIGGDPAKYDAALERLENALGGKPL